MDTLPVELVHAILRHVALFTHARFVCRVWNDILTDPTIAPPAERLLGKAYTALLAETGAENVVRWARKNGCPWDVRACEGAARGGHLALLQWLVGEGCACSDMARAWAAVRGHDDVCQWLDARGCPNRSDYQWHNAITGGHIEVINWLLSLGHVWPDGACSKAAKHGHLEVLQHARRHGCAWDATVCTHAAHDGHFHIVQWALDQGCPCDCYPASKAARRGDLALLQRLVELGAP
ncbi:ankyrin repeat protein [Pandoravirus inopinatum]|uniref:Ankyrin repeat protein n=1 Tax=Pandoravirus inopinatum TaxID=1605721 RepID=A0A0B5J985_9VIRU|nr:ankyrin repeat protein [Pandoravirus inopinatum]AJF97401.1 ankyrin repeat protein [Pandoravirus inopinatum]